MSKSVIICKKPRTEFSFFIAFETKHIYEYLLLKLDIRNDLRPISLSMRMQFFLFRYLPLAQKNLMPMSWPHCRRGAGHEHRAFI